MLYIYIYIYIYTVYIHIVPTSRLDNGQALVLLSGISDRGYLVQKNQRSDMSLYRPNKRGQ